MAPEVAYFELCNGAKCQPCKHQHRSRDFAHNLHDLCNEVMTKA
jgi:hypothetical protein